jgi:hypothetical protein
MLTPKRNVSLIIKTTRVALPNFTVEMALYRKKGWHRMTYIEAWAGGPNAVALDAVYGGFINVPRTNHAIRLLVGTPDGQRPIKAFRGVPGVDICCSVRVSSDIEGRSCGSRTLPRHLGCVRS